MKKQVVAIILVMVLVITTFAACGKKYKMFTDKDGVKHPMVIDGEGNTVRNPDGNIAVYQTDKNGEVVTDKDGKDVINGIIFPDYIVDGQVFETEDFKWQFSKEWEIDGDTIKKKDTTIELSISKPSGITFDKIVEGRDEKLIELPNSEEATIVASKESANILGAEKALCYKYTTNSKDINIYTENYIFQINNHIYQAVFVCDQKDKDLIDFATIFEAIKVR